MTKTSEMSLEAFRLAVAEHVADLRNKALQTGVTKESIDEIISGTYSQFGEYGLMTNVRRIRSAIQNKIEAASADTLVGMLVGSRDRVGKNSPIRFTLVKKDGKHIEVSNFGSVAQYKDQKIEIPVPALVTLKAQYDAEYDSWNLISIEDYRPIGKDQLVKGLSSMVIPLMSITKDMAYSQGHAAKPVVISGSIVKAGTEAVFRYEDPEEEGGRRQAIVDHYLPVFCQREMAKDQKDSLPCFQFGIRSKERGANFVRCHISQQRHGQPTIFVEDIDGICADAVRKYPDNPEAQADNLTEWLKDLNCIVVGTVATFKSTYTEDKQARNYIDVSVSALVSTEGSVEGGSVQKSIVPPEVKTATPPITTESRPVPGKVVSSPPATETTTPVPPPTPARIIDIGKKIIIFCRAAGIKPDDITLSMLKTKALDVVDGVPDSVVKEAIAYASEKGV